MSFKYVELEQDDLWELGHCLFASVSIDEELSIVHKVLEK
jgi:hypothetical protein